jgi:hypothetical protein
MMRWIALFENFIVWYVSTIWITLIFLIYSYNRSIRSTTFIGCMHNPIYCCFYLYIYLLMFLKKLIMSVTLMTSHEFSFYIIERNISIYPWVADTSKFYNRCRYRLRICSNAWGFSYSDRCVMWFPSVLLGKCRSNTYL